MVDDQDLTPDEQRLLKVVNMGIQQVVVPAMDNLEQELKKEFRTEIGKVNNRLDRVENRLDQLDRKLDRFSGMTMDNKHQLDVKNPFLQLLMS